MASTLAAKIPVQTKGMGINLDAKRVWLHKNYTVVRMQILDVDKLKMIRQGKGDQFADDFEVEKAREILTGVSRWGAVGGLRGALAS